METKMGKCNEIGVSIQAFIMHLLSRYLRVYLAFSLILLGLLLLSTTLSCNPKTVAKFI